VLVTQPARVLRAAIEPRQLTLRWGAHGGGSITVIVVDEYGNPVPGLALELRPVSAELRGPVALPPADAQGRTVVSLTPAQVRRGCAWCWVGVPGRWSSPRGSGGSRRRRLCRWIRVRRVSWWCCGTAWW